VGAVGQLIRDQGFHNGLLFGTIALVALTAIAVLRPSTAERARAPLRLAGLAAVAAAIAALDRTGVSVLLDDRLVWGVTLLAVLPLVATIVGGPTHAAARLGAALVAIPGTFLVAGAAEAQNAVTWVPWFVLVVVVVGGALAADCDEANARVGLVPVMLAMTAAGMWTTVPDTEQVLVVIGVLGPMALLGWPVPRAAHGAAIYGVIGLLAWVAAVGGRGRPGSVVGGVACLGLLLAEPVARRALGRRAGPPPGPWTWRYLATLFVHGSVVLVAARVAGLRVGGAEALVWSTIALAGGVVASMLVLASWPRPAPHTPAPHTPAPHAIDDPRHPPDS
jgi:hypothetical protein